MADTLKFPTPPQGDRVDPAKIARVEIFPPIGIARVGNSGATDTGEPDPKSKIEFFYGPEVPGITDVPHVFGVREWSFRDGSGKIKRQAVRFRVYAYDKAGNVLGEINNTGGYTLNWSVHVANKKAAFYCFSGRLRPRNTNLRNPDVDSEPAKGGELSGDPFDQSLEGRKKLIVDPGCQKIARSINAQGEVTPVQLKGKFQGSLPNASDAIDVTLGELRTDPAGRLVFIGGSGVARSIQGPGATTKLVQPEIISEFDSLDWIDSVCDGWVDVQVGHAKRPNLARELPRPHKATVLSAPPKFAWGIDSPVTLYDIMENFYKDEMSYVDHSGTDFYKDIWPVLAGTYRLAWVNAKAFQGHGPRGYGDFLPKESDLSTPNGDPAQRQHIFGRLREPNFRNQDQAHVILMPRLSGDNGDAVEPGTTNDIVGEPIQRFSALTEVQYNRFKDWKDGKFVTGTPYGTKKFIEEYDKAEQPVLLTRAMLEQTIGDPLYPGIEVYWIAKLAEVYDFSSDLKSLHPPFRIDHTKALPGFLSRGLSLPWQSDFDLCNTHWWPSARPDDVFVLPGTEPLGPGGAAHGVSLEDFMNPAVPGIDDMALIATNAPRRKGWARGLRDTPEEVSASFFPGSTDMVQFWTRLGFVKKLELGPATQGKIGAERGAAKQAPPSVWVERERQDINGFT
ncbi:hypothetical protein VTO73DRAFT_1577 [Trametes versicolor]